MVSTHFGTNLMQAVVLVAIAHQKGNLEPMHASLHVYIVACSTICGLVVTAHTTCTHTKHKISLAAV